jgi:hypothetical protein
MKFREIRRFLIFQNFPMDMTDEKSIENQIALSHLPSHQKIKRNFLHQASSKDLVKSQPNFSQVFTLSVNVFSLPRPHENLIPDFGLVNYAQRLERELITMTVDMLIT